LVYYYNLGVADWMGGCGHGNYNDNSIKRAYHNIIILTGDDRFVRIETAENQIVIDVRVTIPITYDVLTYSNGHGRGTIFFFFEKRISRG